MRTDIAYLVTDFRKVPAGSRFTGIGILQAYPGVLELQLDTGGGLQWEDEEGYALEDDEAAGTVVLHTPNGYVHLQKLDAEHWDAVKVELGDIPNFQTAEAANRFFVERIQRSFP